MVYDTIYALQDAKDDLQTGVKSTAIRFGDNLFHWLTFFSCLSVTSFALAGYMNQCGVFYYSGVVGAAGAYIWLLRGISKTPTNQVGANSILAPMEAASRFRSSRWVCGFLVIGTGIEVLIKIIWK